MPVTERLQQLDPIIFVSKAAVSLLHNKPGSALEQHRPCYIDMTRTRAEEPLNREEEIFSRFMQIAEERNLREQQRPLLEPYWLPRMQYNPLEVLGTLVQFLGQHNSPLPTTVLPPERDITTYVDEIMRREGKVTIPEQFEILLDITDNDLLGAANLGFIASRLMARGDDIRAYPGLSIGRQEMLAWNDKVAKFEMHTNSERNDGPGDTYYFWTYVFAELFYSRHEHKAGKLMQYVFEHATPAMKFVKDKFAHKPIIADHYEASTAGRRVGLALARLLALTT